VRHILLIGVTLATPACTKVDVAAEMESALVVTNHAIGLALLTTDIASYQLEIPSEVPTQTTDSADTGLNDTGTTDTGARRHGEGGPCPELFAVSDALIEVDYRTGCLPRSGLMPVVVSGTVFVERNETSFDGQFDTYAINLSHTVTGSIEGTTTQGPNALQISTTFDITAKDGKETLRASGNTTAKLTGSEVTLDGDLRINEASAVKVSLDGLTLDLSDIPGECPEPSGGSATAGLSREAIVDYTTPGNGQVTVAYGKRTSDDVRLCAFRSWLF
jgi:hypothetical protein